MPIIKRDSIDNSIFRELREKYPPVAAYNNVQYRQTLDYLTFEPDFILDPKLRKVRRRHGNDVIAIIFSLRAKMCRQGWKIRMDGEHYESLIGDCAHECAIEETIVKNVLKNLLKEEILYAVTDDESIEQGTWLTCPQQVYNYEMACSNRQNNRRRQARNRATAQENRIRNQNASNQDMGYAPSQNIGYAPGQDMGYAPSQDMGYASGQDMGYASGQDMGYASGQDMEYAPNQPFQDTTYAANEEKTCPFVDDELPFN